MDIGNGIICGLLIRAREGAGWKFIRKEELYTISFDVIIIMSDRFLQEIEDESVGMGG